MFCLRILSSQLPLTGADLQLPDPGGQALRLDTLMPEIISMIYEEARLVSEPYEHLSYSLICKTLQPFGQEILYREVDFLDLGYCEKLCTSAQPDWLTTDDERCESARRSADFLISLLPNLQAPQIAHFRYLSLDLASPAVPQSWLQTALERLFFLFRDSEAVLVLLVAFRSLDTPLVRLVTETGKTAFRQVRVEFLDLEDQKDPGEYSPTHADVVLLEPNTSEHGFLACSALTQDQSDFSPLWVLDDEEARHIYFIAAYGRGFFHSVSAAAPVTTVEIIRQDASPSSLASLEASLQAFQQARVVKLNLREIVGHADLEVPRKVKLPASTTILIFGYDGHP